MTIVTIGGLPGSGKSTVARLLAERLKMEYFNAGDVFRSLATKRGLTLEEFGIFAEKNPSVDQAIDKKVVELAKKDNIVLEGRLAGVMCERNGIKAIKVWLEAPLKVRAQRVAEREGKSFDTALAEIQVREKSEWDRYYQIYNIDLNDLTIYNYVIDSAPISAQQVVEAILRGLKE
ncbi:MAG: (d)CMP kinase [Thermoplasmatota archaeon]